MTAPTFVKALPKFQPRNLSEYAELAKTKPGEYLELPWPEDHAGRLTRAPWNFAAAS
jgi:hypothetical protein